MGFDIFPYFMVLYVCGKLIMFCSVLSITGLVVTYFALVVCCGGLVGREMMMISWFCVI